MNFPTLLGRKMPVHQAPKEGNPATLLEEPAGPTTPPTNEAGGGSLLDSNGADTLAAGEGADTLAPSGNDTLAADAATVITLEDLSLPEGFDALVLEKRTNADGTTEDVLAVTEALSILNNKDISGAERAKQLLSLNTKMMTNLVEEQAATWKKMQSDWQTEAKALPEIGGAKLPETLASIKKGLEVLGAQPSFYEALRITGAGNHPEVIRVLHLATKHLKEGSSVSGGPPSGKLTLAASLYPSLAQ